MAARRSARPPDPLASAFAVRPAPVPWRRVWGTALTTSLCYLLGLATGHVQWGAWAFFGGFGSFYVVGQPYRRRAVVLGAAVLGLAMAMFLGGVARAWWVTGPVLSAVSAASTYLAGRWRIPLPSGLMFILVACLSAAQPHAHLAARVLFVLIGGAIAWLVGMSGWPLHPHAPEVAAVRDGFRAVAACFAPGSDGGVPHHGVEAIATALAATATGTRRNHARTRHLGTLARGAWDVLLAALGAVAETDAPLSARVRRSIAALGDAAAAGAPLPAAVRRTMSRRGDATTPGGRLPAAVRRPITAPGDATPTAGRLPAAVRRSIAAPRDATATGAPLPAAVRRTMSRRGDAAATGTRLPAAIRRSTPAPGDAAATRARLPAIVDGLSSPRFAPRGSRSHGAADGRRLARTPSGANLLAAIARIARCVPGPLDASVPFASAVPLAPSAPSRLAEPSGPLGQPGPPGPEPVQDMPAAALRPAPLLPLSALRIGIAVALSVVTAHLLGMSHLYWVPLTCAAVLQGESVLMLTRRAIQRVAGTVAGLLLAGALLAGFHLGPVPALGLVVALQSLMLMVIAKNYAVAVVFVTAFAFLILSVISPAPALPLVLARLTDTLLGVAVALAATYLLWPRASSRRLPAVLMALIAHDRDLLTDLMLGDAASPPATAARRASVLIALVRAREVMEDARAEVPTARAVMALLPLAHAAERLGYLLLAAQAAGAPVRTDAAAARQAEVILDAARDRVVAGPGAEPPDDLPVPDTWPPLARGIRSVARA